MSWGLGRREKKKKDCPPVQFCAQSVQSGLSESRMAQGLGSEAQRRLFEQIRQAVPLVDAAIGKIIRLVGDFELECSNRQAQEELRRWCSQVPVGAGGSGLRQFLHSYLDDLLTYGNAVGEMVPFCEREGIAALYNVPLENILIRQGENPLDVKLFANSRMGEAVELAHPERVLYTALNPKAGSVQGRSLLEGLPFVSSVLLNIYQAIGQNFERMPERLRSRWQVSGRTPCGRAVRSRILWRWAMWTSRSSAQTIRRWTRRCRCGRCSSRSLQSWDCRRLSWD